MNYFFLLFLTLGLYSISNKINYYFVKKNENIIINTFIFSFFFVLIYLVNSYLFLLNINSKYFSYLFILISTIICLFQGKEIFNYLKIIKSHYLKNKILLLILTFYFLLILFPPADEDSLRYHLEIGKKINNGTFYYNTWFDYVGLGAHEFINSFALHLNFENISSYANFIYLSFAIISNIYILNKYKKGSGILSAIILLSSPYLIALISSQKFYFFPCYIVSYSIAYLYLEKKINLFVIYLILILNIFCVIIKPIFLPYLVLVSCWLLIKKTGYKYKILYLFVSSIICLILYFPIFFIKLKIYNDPFLPFISINNNNTEWFSHFHHYLTIFNMDFTDSIENNLLLKYLLVPFKLVFPLRPSDLFKTLGLGLLFAFSIHYKKNKHLLSLLIFFVLSVVVVNNYQTRWFLPLLIFISIFANLNYLNFLKKITYIQLLGISCILIPMGLATFSSNVGLLSKKFIMEKVFPANEMIDYINKNYKYEKIFANLNYYYYFDNIIPVYYPSIVKLFEPDYYEKHEADTKLILWKDENIKSLNFSLEKKKDRALSSNNKNNSKETSKVFLTSNPNFLRRMDLIDFLNENFECKKLDKIEEFEFGIGRNFFNHEKSKTKFVLYRLSC